MREGDKKRERDKGSGRGRGTRKRESSKDVESVGTLEVESKAEIKTRYFLRCCNLPKIIIVTPQCSWRRKARSVSSVRKTTLGSVWKRRFQR